MFIRIIDCNSSQGTFTVFNGKEVREVAIGIFEFFAKKLVVVDDEACPGERVNARFSLAVSMGVVPPDIYEHKVSIAELKATEEFFSDSSSTLGEVDVNYAKLMTCQEDKMVLKVWGFRHSEETIEIPFNWEAATAEDVARVKFELQSSAVGVVDDPDYGGMQTSDAWLRGLKKSYNL